MVASQKQLEGTTVTRIGDSNTKVLAPTFTMVAANAPQEAPGPFRKASCISTT